ncbi:polysaccharide biosynthesis tyrosine autokinase [Cetobacterium sp.]|uniref:polysaccharide biosynthesis tyrosine autokinase n=1 Tax=Cetobacterium sp. TaxID=2071632 RepID=UPI003F2CBB10
MENSNEFKVDLVDIVFILKRRWKIIVLSSVIFFTVGIKYISGRPVVYSAMATLMIRNNMFDDSKNLESMATLLEIAKSKSITERVVQKYGLNMSSGSIAAGINIAPVRGTEFIKLSYTGSEPGLTAAITNEVATEFINRVEEILSRSNLKILEKAEVPRYPAPIKKIKILFAASFLGAALGIGLSILIELFNRKLRRSEEIENILETKTIGVIPNLKKFYPKTAVKRDIFFDNEYLKEVRESIRLIRTNINFIDMSNKKVIVFTSSIPKEGKTTIASNYALSEAIGGKKVLILDCDVKRPRIDKSYDIDAQYGIVDMLLGKKTIQDVLIKGVRENLDVITGGKNLENTTELFLTDKFQKCIEELKKSYDLIVIDTPPLAVGTDGAIISQQADGVVFVVSYDQVHKVELEFAKKMLKTAAARIYGVVINKVSNEGYSYGEYGYYSYNYSYYKDYYKNEEGENVQKNSFSYGFSFIKRILSKFRAK